MLMAFTLLFGVLGRRLGLVQKELQYKVHFDEDCRKGQGGGSGDLVTLSQDTNQEPMMCWPCSRKLPEGGGI